jgi:hypothetical protein
MPFLMLFPTLLQRLTTLVILRVLSRPHRHSAFSDEVCTCRQAADLALKQPASTLSHGAVNRQDCLMTMNK